MTIKENLILIGQEPFLALTWEPDFSQHAVFFFFNCYLAALRPTLGHYRGGSHTRPMLIAWALHIRPEGHRKPRNEFGSLSRAKHLVEFEFWSQCLNPLGHSPRMLMNHKNFLFVQIPDKTNDVIFLNSPKTLFLGHFWPFVVIFCLNDNFWSFFPKNPALAHATIYGSLKPG